MDDNRSALLLGYTQVDDFGPDEEYESGEEVEYVTLDLGAIGPTLVPSSSAYRLIGLDTPTPFLQLSGTIFKGHHQNLLGTELLFTDAKETSGSKKSVAHVANTERRIRFREAQLRPKSPGQNGGPAAGDGEQADSAGHSAKGKARAVDDLTGSQGPTRARGRGRARGRARGRGRGRGRGRDKASSKGKERAWHSGSDSDSEEMDFDDMPDGRDESPVSTPPSMDVG